MTRSSRRRLSAVGPITRRRAASAQVRKLETRLDISATCLDRLLEIATTSWPIHGEDSVVHSVLDALGTSFPERAFAVSIAEPSPDPDGPTAVRAWRRLPHLPVEAVAPTDRFFPDLPDELSATTERGPFRCSVAVATDPAGIDPQDIELTLANRASLALAATLQSVRSQHERATDLAVLEARAVQAEKLATLGQLAAGLVHELNNPLTAILGYADYLRTKAERGAGDPNDLERLRRICDAAARMIRFSRDLIGYARPSRPSRLPLSVHEVIDNAFGLCAHLFSEANIEFERHYAPNVPPVVGAADQLIQVFVNLLTNACHAMPNGGTLNVRTALDTQAPLLRITVSDDGSGIDEAILPRIFEPFFTTKSEGHGSGLGLFIVRRILTTHGGTIDVQTRTGMGTTVQVVLPLTTDSPSWTGKDPSSGQR